MKFTNNNVDAIRALNPAPDSILAYILRENERSLTMDYWKEHFEWVELASRYQPQYVLDFGSGSGCPALFLASAGFFVLGYDKDPDMVAAANLICSVQSDEIKRRCSFTATMPTPNRYHFPLIWISHTLEHIPLDEWPEVFEALKSLGDTVFISVPEDHAYDSPGHVNHWPHMEVFVADLKPYVAKFNVMERDGPRNVFRVEATL
jgi:SAM-dependent methyltransferase